MSNTRLGGNLTTLKERMRSPRIQKTPSGNKVTHLYDVDFTSAESAITAAGFTFGDAHAAPYETSLLKEMAIIKDGPKNAIVEVAYYPEGFETPETVPPAGTIIKEGNSNVIQIPIEQHPDWDSTLRPLTKRGQRLEGVTSYVSPQPVYERRDYVDTFTWTESALVKNVGKRWTEALMDAEGIESATDFAWMMMERRIKEAGGVTERSRRWQYAENLWSSDIYVDASLS